MTSTRKYSEKTSSVILTCLKMNVEAATTPGMKEFTQGQLKAYEDTLARRSKPKPQPPRAFARFLEKLDQP